MVAVLTLALGVGANTAIFSVLDALMFRPLPFPAADQIVRIYSTKNGARMGGTASGSGPSPMDMRDFAQLSHSFQKMVVYDTWRKNVSFGSSGGEPEQMRVGLVPAAYFEELDVQPIIGRLFTEDENQEGKHYVAAISARLWEDRFGADSGILGRKIRINDEPYTIVAVMPDTIPEWQEPWRPGLVPPQGLSLRSGFFGPGPSTLISPIRPTRGHIAISPTLRLIRDAFAVRERLGNPRVVPSFCCAFLLDMPPSMTAGSSSVAFARFLHR